MSAIVQSINIARKPEFGEIWSCSLPQKGGSVQGGKRPVFILSNNLNNRYSPTINVIPLTSASKQNLPIHVPLKNYAGYGLKRPSTLLVEQITTIPAESLGMYIGRISDKPTLSRIYDAFNVQFPIVAMFV